MSPRLLVIGCGKAKLDRPAPARELYTGSLFRAARRYAEESGDRWMIVSAKHGLIDPDRVIEPYDATIRDVLRGGKIDKDWSDQVARTVYGLWPQRRSIAVHVHAGAAYVSALWLALRLCQDRQFADIGTPLRGLMIGERLRWYAQRRAA